MIELILSMLVAVLSAAVAIGIMYYLVSKNFFLSRVVRVIQGMPLSTLWAATWVLAVMGTTLAFLSLFGERIIPWLTLASSQVRPPRWDLPIMWKSMSLLTKSVVGGLFCLSAWSLGVMIDRVLIYSAARKQSRVFVQQVAGALREGKLDEAISIAERNKRSHIAKLVATGLSEFQAASPLVADAELIEAAKRGLDRSVAIVHAEMKRGLSGLATIGSTAPFVGLFGTVVGIINAFKGIETTKATGLSAVAGGISEALVTTALGLLVAVPAVWAYNYFTGRLRGFDIELDNQSKELIDMFISLRVQRKKRI
jgi:biopolymer transport protein ExbB/TolQ